ncbi:MAG TPA: hypothetical protein PKA90_07905 [Ignavibacteria bacterium]|nr:hypothetical protein [Ignavibacteria bacterium]HMR40342.1 hypothetical protein [Ignavibacteria bacterium]
MDESNFIKLLKTFSPDEFKDFFLLVKSPFFNREKVLIRFSELLKKYYPDFNEINLDKRKIFVKLFPGKKYNDALLRNTVSDMVKLAEEYLKIIQMRKDPFYEQYNLLKELTNRKQQKLFKMNFRKAEKILKETGIADEIYYQNSFLLEDEHRRNIVVNSSRILFKDDNMDKHAYFHNLHFIIENIKIYAILLNQSKHTYDHKFDFRFYEYLRKYIEENIAFYKHIPYIIIFYNCVMIFLTGEKTYFDELKLLVKKHYSKLTLTDRKNMFIVLTNHCNTQIKSGNDDFKGELFEINMEMLKTKAYLEGNDFMAHYIYNAIAVNAINYEKTDWADKFVERYRTMLHSDFRESSYNYCKALITLEKGKPDESLGYLSRVEALDIFFKLFINSTLLKIYFRKNEYEAFLSLVDSFRHFLKRNKELRNADRVQYNNFIFYIKKIFTIKSKHGKKEISEYLILKDKIERINETVHKDWLIKILNELIKN